jgi:hypothetical protein
MGERGAAEVTLRLSMNQTKTPEAAANGVGGQERYSSKMIAKLGAEGERIFEPEFTLGDRRRWQVNACRGIRLHHLELVGWLVAAGALEPDFIQEAFGDSPGLQWLFTDLVMESLQAREDGREPDFSPGTWKQRYDAQPGRVSDDELAAVFLNHCSEWQASVALEWLFGERAPRREVLAANSARLGGWPELVPLSGNEPEIIDPAKDLVGVVGQMADAVREAICVPGELPAMMALGVMSVAVHGRWEVKIQAGYSEQLSLWACCVLPSASNKSAVLSALSEPLLLWEQRKRIEVKPLILAAIAECKAAKARIAKLEKQAGSEPDAGIRSEIASEIAMIEASLPKVPANPELFTSDCTPEKLGALMSEHGGRFAVIADEPGIFATLGGRYSGGVANLDAVLSGHSGKASKVHRTMREKVDLPRSYLAMIITAQPGVLERLGDNDEFRDRGFLARFLWTVPKPNLGFRHLDGKPVPQNITEAWGRILTALLDKEPDVDDAGNVIPKVIKLSPDAYAAWRTEWEVNEAEMRPSGPWGDDAIRSWAGKYSGTVARIAGVLHCGICPPGEEPAAKPISLNIMRTAIALGRKLKSHALRAFGIARVSSDLKMAAKIIGWIQSHSVREFTVRQCVIACARGGANAAVVGALGILENHGWIRLDGPRKPEGGRGRESHPYAVNPLAWCSKGADDADRNRVERPVGGFVSALSADFDEGEVTEPEQKAFVSALSAGARVASAASHVPPEAIEWAENACSGGSR